MNGQRPSDDDQSTNDRPRPSLAALWAQRAHRADAPQGEAQPRLTQRAQGEDTRYTQDTGAPSAAAATAATPGGQHTERDDHVERVEQTDRSDREPAGRDQNQRRIMTNDDIEILTGGEDLGIYRAHRRFGGFDLGASIAGLLAAVGMTALLGGLAGGLGTVGYQLDVARDAESLSSGGFIAGLVVIVLSFLVGGWVAGRVARYDGGKNGIAMAVMFVVLSAALAGLGAWAGDKYNVFNNIAVPQWFSTNATTATAVLSAVVGLVVILAAGFIGGKIGERYHTKADKYLAEYAEGNASSVLVDEDAADSGRTTRTRRGLLHHA